MEDSEKLDDIIRQHNAHISYFFNNPFPEDLPDDLYVENIKRLEYLADKNILGPKKNANT